MFYFTPYIILPLLSSAVCGALAVFALRRRHLPIAIHIFWIMLILAVWSLSYTLNTVATSLSLKIFFYRTATTFVAFISVPVIAMAFQLLGYGNRLNHRRLFMLALIPAAAVVLAWTGGHHTLFRHSFFLYKNDPLLLLGFKLGPAWHLYILYTTVLNVTAAILFIWGVWRGPADSRPKFLLLFAGTIVPLLVQNLDPTPVKGFAMVTSFLWFTGCCYAIAIFRHRLLEVAPVARTTLFDRLGDPVLVFDLNGLLVDYNQTAGELLCPGSDPGTAKVHALALARFPALKAVSGNVPVDANDPLWDMIDGERFWEIKSLPLSRGGARVGYLIQLHDTTTLKRSELESRRAHEAAESANRAKSTFLANISHEIRTPMNAIIGMTDLVIDAGLPEEKRAYLETVKHSAESLLSVLNTILDLSKIEAGKLELDETDFDLGQLLGSTIKTLSPQANDKGLKFEFHVGTGVPNVLKGDPAKLKQVLLNLMGNAVKFTEKGCITLGITRQEAEAGITLFFSVKDTGIGIPPDKQAGIFETFTQADGSITRKYGGTGLGLSISRELVRLMEGELQVESEVGRGSTFSFYARFKPGLITEGMAACEEEPVSSHLDRLLVLVVEDIETNRTLVKGLLERQGHIVTAVNNGQEAIHVLEKSEFDIVLMDVQMPDMDGFETTMVIRDPQSAVLRHDVPVIALTAHAMKGDRERCLESGMNGYISKPLSPESFVGTVEKFVLKARASGRPGFISEGVRNMPEGSAEICKPGGLSPLQFMESLLPRYFGDRELVHEIWQAFIKESPEILKRMKGSIDANAPGLLEMHAHSFKSAAGTVGINVMQGIAYNIENAAKSGNMSEAHILYMRLRDELEKILNKEAFTE